MPSSWAAGLHHQRHAAAGGPAPRPAGDRLPFLAKVSFQILLTRPAVNDEGEDEDRVELTRYFLRLAPWIVRPASPSARAGTMMAAIRTKFEVALEHSRFPESDWTVVGITAACLLTAPSQQLPDMPAPPGRSCPRPWPRRRPSGTLTPLLHVVRPRPLPRGRSRGPRPPG